MRIPELRVHKATGQRFVWWEKKRVYLGADETLAQARYRVWLTEQGLPHPDEVRSGLPTYRAGQVGMGSEKVPLEKTGGESVFSLETPQHTHTPPLTLLGALTVPQICTRYLTHFQGLSPDPRAWSRAKKALRRLGEVLDGVPAEAVRLRHLRRWREALMADTPPLSRTYLNHLLTAVRACWQWACEEDLVTAEVLAAVRAFRPLRQGQGGTELPPVPPPEPGAVAAVLPHLHRPVRELVEVLALTGCRPGELVTLRPQDVSRRPDEWLTLPGTRRRVAAVQRPAGLVWVYVPARHKNAHRGKARAILLGPKAQAILGPLLDQTLTDLGPASFVFRPGDAPKGGTHRTAHYTPHAVGTAVERATGRANRARALEGLPPVEPWTPYQLRHLVGTETSEQLGRTAAKARLGHSGYDLLDVYVEQELPTAADAAWQLG